MTTGGPKSPLEGYAPPESRMKLWSNKAPIAGWFPHNTENVSASRFRQQRAAIMPPTYCPTATTNESQMTTTRYGSSRL
jgi:hypothetical protein